MKKPRSSVGCPPNRRNSDRRHPHNVVAHGNNGSYSHLAQYKLKNKTLARFNQKAVDAIHSTPQEDYYFKDIRYRFVCISI